MKSCWIHIGMHKTGTTSVQLNLAEEKDNTDWQYLTLGDRRNMGAALYAMFASEPHRYHWFQKRGDTPEQVALARDSLRSQFSKLLSESNAKNSILSGESLTLIDEAGIEELRSFLNPFFDRILVIGYVRPPIGFKISFFQQRLKHSNCKLDFSDFQLQYRRRFDKFDRTFGREQVLLKKFDPQNLYNQCIVADFRHQIGMSLPATTDIKRVNESLCHEACAILYAYRSFGPAYGVGPDVLKENKRIIAVLLAMKGRPFSVSPLFVKESLFVERKDIHWMERRLEVSLDESQAFGNFGIDREDQLLLVRGEYCREFADAFEAIHKTKIPTQMIPCGDVISPREVADFVEACREFCREMIQGERIAKVPVKKEKIPRKRGFRVTCLRCLRRITGTSRKSQKSEPFST